MANISISLDKLELIIARAIQLGRVEQITQYLPDTQYVNRPAVVSYLKVLGIRPSQLESWEKQGLIHSVQSGSGGTHKYRRIDVQKLLLQYTISR